MRILIAFFATCLLSLSEAEKPNLVYIMVDDMGPADAGRGLKAAVAEVVRLRAVNTSEPSKGGLESTQPELSPVRLQPR